MQNNTTRKNMEEIIKIATEVYGSSPLINGRVRMSVYARSAIYWLLRNDGKSLDSIGKFFGKDHATVMHGLRKHNDLIQFDKEYKNLFDTFYSKVPGSKHFIPHDVYIAGKITGLHNYAERFKEGCDKVRKLGLNPINPVTLPHRHNKSWEAYMRECIIAMLNCKYIYALNNWQDSKGATIEVNLAISLNKTIIYEPE